MCLIAFDWRPDSEANAHRLALIANRDEFFDRPTLPLHGWNDAPILAGRDLREGGTWMGLTPQGRFAALTNFRSGAAQRADATSRGQLVAEALGSALSCEAFVHELAQSAEQYNGFNLIYGNVLQGELWYFSNRSTQHPQRLGAGMYGLSNGLLDEAWPKVSKAKAALHAQLNARDDQGMNIDALLQALQDDARAADDELPHTGVPLAVEQRLSSLFIPATQLGDKGVYGTRSSSVLRVSTKAAQWHERTVSSLTSSHQAANHDVHIHHPFKDH